MLREDRNRLRHMLDAAKEALALAAGRSREDLDRDRQLVLALLRLLEIVGEAASNVTLGFRASQPQIPWRELIGMHHRLIHAYHDVNLDAVWKTLQTDAPPLVERLEQLLSPPGPNP